MKKYTIIISGHRNVIAKDDKEAFKIVDQELKHCHTKFNLTTIAEL